MKTKKIIVFVSILYTMAICDLFCQLNSAQLHTDLQKYLWWDLKENMFWDAVWNRKKDIEQLKQNETLVLLGLTDGYELYWLYTHWL